MMRTGATTTKDIISLEIIAITATRLVHIFKSSISSTARSAISSVMVCVIEKQ